MNRRIAPPITLYFSYSQFFVFDAAVKLPGCAWTEAHFRQGFARREEQVNFGTLLEFGFASISIFGGTYEPQADYERIIEVPISVPSGAVVVEGPEGVDEGRRITMTRGHYRLVAAQMVHGDRERIDLFFDTVAAPLARSRILVADESLDSPDVLLETADVA